MPPAWTDEESLGSELNFCSAENERLPTELGWNVRDEVVEVQAILRISDMIGKATSLFTGSGEESGGSGTAKKLRRGFHAGVRRDL